jgi:NAD(P)-dependent dehydrogenase (short-subunit alcohol dehydrogenase family)
MPRLGGKVAFITGAAGGIGRAIAFAMAREGAHVAISDINEKLLADAMTEAKGLSVEAVPCDVTDREMLRSKVDAFAQKHGGLDIFVNNAVYFHYDKLADFDAGIVDRMLDVGLKGTYWGFQAATPHLVKRGSGCFINLSSIAVSMAIPNASVYSSIKGAIDTLTRQQAAELGPHNVRVNALAPGSVATPGANAIIDEKGWESRKSKTLLKRLVTAEEIGHAAVFLASDEAASITGVTLLIDAGMAVAGP